MKPLNKLLHIFEADDWCFKDIKGIICFLLRKGADINAQDRYGYTPLHVACETGRDSCVKLLIEYGADANTKNDIGNTVSSTYVDAWTRALQP